MNAPRYWDGRIRQVLTVRYLDDRRVETLSCGHEKVPLFREGLRAFEPYIRVCFRCPPMAEAAP